MLAQGSRRGAGAAGRGARAGRIRLPCRRRSRPRRVRSPRG